MPIRDKSVYPPNWKAISKRIRFERANGHCEWCHAPHGRTILRSTKDPAQYVILGEADYYYLTSDGVPLRDLPPDFEDTGENGVKVILTVAHIDHDTTNNDDSNLAALCQRCHLRHDAKFHAQNASVTRSQKRRTQAADAGQSSLFDEEEL